MVYWKSGVALAKNFLSFKGISWKESKKKKLLGKARKLLVILTDLNTEGDPPQG